MLQDPVAIARALVRASTSDSASGIARVTVVTPSGSVCVYKFVVQEIEQQDEQPTPCAADILTVLREVRRRMTTAEILSALEQAGFIHGESTVKVTLARLVRDGDIDNDPEAKPRGYKAV